MHDECFDDVFKNVNKIPDCVGKPSKAANQVRVTALSHKLSPLKCFTSYQEQL